MEYTGFTDLIKKIAYIAAEDIGDSYTAFCETPGFCASNPYLVEHLEKVSALDKKYNGEMSHILRFIYLSEKRTEIELDVCEALYQLIKDYDDGDVVYGYFNSADSPTFKQFQELVKDCIDNKCSMVL